MCITSIGASLQRGDPLGKLSSLKFEGVTCFLWAQKVSIADIHAQLMEADDNDMMSRLPNGATFASGQDNLTYNKKSGQ
jgi:hypothetical protein